MDKDLTGSILEENPIDIKRYVSLFLSNWYWFAISLLLALSLAYGINRYSEKIYTVSSTLLIKDDQIGGGVTGAENFIPGGEYFGNKQNLNNELGILKSFSLNHKVIEQLKDFHIIYVAVGKRNIVEKRLYNNCPFIVVADSQNYNITNYKIGVRILNEKEYLLQLNGEDDKGITKSFGDKINNDRFSFTVKLRNPEEFQYKENKSNKFLFWFVDIDQLANTYRSKLIAVPYVENASLVTLSCKGPVVEQEVDYLNKLMEVYIDYGVDIKNRTAISTINFIEDQLNLIRKDLSVAESNMEIFRVNNKIVDLSSKGSEIQAKLDKVTSDKAMLVIQQKYYLYLKEYLTSKDRVDDLISPTLMGISDQEILRLIQDFGNLQNQKEVLSLNLKNNIPASNIIDSKIQRTKASMLENVNESLKKLALSMRDADSSLMEVNSEIQKLPETERNMVTIEREFNVNNTVYTYLLEKKAEAGIAKASNVSDNRPIDNAYTFNSSMIKPKIRKNLLMALVFGTFLPMLAIFIIDFLNNRIIDKKDVEKGTNAPIIGYISHCDFKSEIPVNEKPGSTLSESFRSVRTSLKYFVKEESKPVIAISSAISSEGKTFISVNLATIIAMLGKKVLLVGLDLRKPRIHKILESENTNGMSEYLSGEIDFNDAIKKTSIKNLWHAPSGFIPPNPAELIEGNLMKSFIAKAREEFDYIIIDTPPIAVVTDALLITPLIDMCILVVRQRYTSKNTLSLIQELYKNGTLKNLGIVVNDISTTGYYGYGLRYGYSLGYGYNYGYNYYGHSYGKYGRNYGDNLYYSDEKQ